MTNDEKAKKYYEECIGHLEQEDIENALKKIRKAYKADPDSLEIIETYAIVLNLSGETEESKKIYKDLISKYPSELYPRLNYITLLVNMELIDEAYELFEETEEIFEEKLRQFPKSHELYILGANTYYQLDLIDEAVMLLFRGIQELPSRYEFYRELAIIYYEIGIYEEAITVCEKALKMERADPTIYLYLGLSLQKMNYIHKALEYLSISFTLDPTQPELETLLDKLEEIIEIKGKTIEEIIRDSRGRKKYTGTVKWFDEEKGIGAVECSDFDEELFLHYTAIQMQGFQTVSENIPVTFTAKKTDKGDIITKLWFENNEISKRYTGKIRDFDERTGIGTLVSEDTGELLFHYSGIMDRIVKIMKPGTMVTFSLFTIEGYPQAFNIKEARNSSAGKKKILSPENRMNGIIKWFDQKIGYGIIETDDGLEVVLQKANLPADIGNINPDTEVEFSLDEIESIEGEKIPRAINVVIRNI